jgi:hypothetical protein
MNYFIELKIWDRDRTLTVRPDHVVAVERRDDEPYEVIILSTGDTFWIERGQFWLNKLTNHTSHAGMKVL